MAATGVKSIPAPIVNQDLADLFKGRSNPIERFASNQGAALMLYSDRTADELVLKGRPVVLACGHLTITKAFTRHPAIVAER